ncbi:MAG: DUF1295 domain-containing protein [Pseudomonadota bacterium]
MPSFDLSDAAILAYAWGLAAAGFLLALWPLSVALRDASVVDFWWGPGMALMAVAAWVLAGSPMGAHALAAAGLVTVWGLRLGAALGARRMREAHEDPRYQELRRAWDPGFWWKSLFVVFALQALLQGLVALGALWTVLTPASPAGGLWLAGVIAAAAGLTVEAAADRQLDRFKTAAGATSGALCRDGLRAYVRFPHYAGEIVFWVGIALIALDAGLWWAPAPAALIAALLIKVSGAPMLEEHLERTRPDYAAWAAETPAFVPRIAALRAAARRAIG